MNRGRRVLLAALCLLCAGFGLRVYQLAAHGLWYDEAFTAWIVAKDWAGIIDFARTPKLEHPPVYYLLLHAWTLVAGQSEFALRYFSVFCSVLTIPLLFSFTRRWFGSSLAHWTLVLGTFSPFLIVYAQEARMYALALVASLLALDAFLRWLSGAQHAWKLYILFSLLSVSIHYYAALLLVVENVFLVVYAWRRARSSGGLGWNARAAQWLAWNVCLLGGAALLFTFAPGPRETILLVFSHPLFAGRSPEELRTVLADLAIGGVVIRPLSPADLVASAVLVAVVGVGVVLWRAQLGRSRYGSLILWLVLLPPIAAAAVPLIYAARYIFVIVPALILLSAAALAALQEHRKLLLLVAAGMLVPALYGIAFNYGFAKSTYREMAALATGQARPSDGLVLEGVGQWPLVFYYVGDRWAQAYIPGDADHAELVDIDSAMRAMQAAHPRLWVLSEQAGVVDPGNNVARWLSLNAFPVERTWFNNGDSVALYDSGHALLPPKIWNTQFGDWLMLEQSKLSAPQSTAGDDLAVELNWHALKPIPQPLQLLVTLRLYDSAGSVVQQRVTKPCDGFCPIDNWIPGESMDDRHGLQLPANIPAGEYSLRLEVFSPRQAQSLPVLGPQAPAGASLELARVSVRALAASGQ